MIDRYTVPWKTVTKNKMADRFAESNNILILCLKDNTKNKNTQQGASNWINVGPIGFLLAECVNLIRQHIKPNCQLFVWNSECILLKSIPYQTDRYAAYTHISSVEYL